MAVVRAAADVDDDGKETVEVVGGGGVGGEVGKFQLARKCDSVVKFLHSSDGFDVFETFQVER